ncbi:MAG: hypothetical protein ACXVC6_01700 [Bacteroidia bacterium]
MLVEPKEITKTKKKLKHKTVVTKERQTIVHCKYNPLAAVRVWPTTFLVEKESGRRAKLITAFNITFAPEWTFGNKNSQFTLVFEGLSKDCSMFDLVEDIPLPDPFVIKNIRRNKTDVYTVNIA